MATQPTQTSNPQSGAQESQASVLASIRNAAAYYHVPVLVLWGVYGMESDFGAQPQTSSAGAVGPFQIMPSEWSTWAPKVFGPGWRGQSIHNAGSAAYVAAAILADNYRQGHHSWDFAVRAYNAGVAGARAGHGYTLNQVLAKAHSKPFLHPGNQAQGGIVDVTPGGPTLRSGVNSVADFLKLLANPQTWLRILEGLVGIVLLVMALRQFAAAAGGSQQVVGPPIPKAVPV